MEKEPNVSKLFLNTTTAIFLQVLFIPPPPSSPLPPLLSHAQENITKGCNPSSLQYGRRDHRVQRESGVYV